jgi:hypothetical protein
MFPITGTVQGAVATWRPREALLPNGPGRYRSLYRTGASLPLNSFRKGTDRYETY